MWESIEEKWIPWECLMHIIRVPGGHERKWTGAIFDEIIAEDFPKIMKEFYWSWSLQEAYGTLKI